MMQSACALLEWQIVFVNQVVIFFKKYIIMLLEAELPLTNVFYTELLDIRWLMTVTQKRCALPRMLTDRHAKPGKTPERYCFCFNFITVFCLSIFTTSFVVNWEGL